MRGRGFVAAVALVALGLALPARADAPANQYEAYAAGDPIIRDVATGLWWQRCPTFPPPAQAKCPKSSALLPQMSQATAIASCAALSLGGHATWRLPTYKELQTLVDETIEWEYDDDAEANTARAIDQKAFPNTPSNAFWSQTVAPDGSGFSVDFKTGQGGPENVTTLRFARCVLVL